MPPPAKPVDGGPRPAATAAERAAEASVEPEMEENKPASDGAGSGDVNGDGLPDLYVCGMEQPNALYLNKGNWKFRVRLRLELEWNYGS